MRVSRTIQQGCPILFLLEHFFRLLPTRISSVSTKVLWNLPERTHQCCPVTSTSIWIRWPRGSTPTSQLTAWGSKLWPPGTATLPLFLKATWAPLLGSTCRKDRLTSGLSLTSELQCFFHATSSNYWSTVISSWPQMVTPLLRFFLSLIFNVPPSAKVVRGRKKFHQSTS